MYRGDGGLGVSQQLKNRDNIPVENRYRKGYVSEFMFHLSYLFMTASHYLSYHDCNTK